jgi:SulP family sulfate permease
MLLLNVTGIELLVKQDIDLNRELVAAGAGNLVGGLFGAIPGFHTISLTALNLRMSGGSRVTTLAAAAFCLLVAFLGPLALAYTPRFILGGLVAYLGLSMLEEWGVRARKRFPLLEYFVILLILAVSAVSGFLYGVAVGLLAAVVLFVISYSQIDVVKHRLSGLSFQSRVTRAASLRKALLERGEEIYILQLQGYLFFGTANRLVEGVRARLGETGLPLVRFVVMDFQQVTGIDSTAILSFTKMDQIAGSHAITLVFTALSPAAEVLLRSSGLGESGGIRFFPDLDRGVEWCEEELLRAEGISAVEQSLVEQLSAQLPEQPGLRAALEFLDRQDIEPGAYLMRQGEPPDKLYFVEKGQVTVQREPSSGAAPVRLETMGSGRVVGEIGFYLDQTRTAAVRADEPTTVYRLSREQLAQMEKADPEAASAFHRLVVHLLAERVTHLIRTVDALLR